MLRKTDWQGHEKKGSKAVAHMFILQFPQVLSGQPTLNGHKIKEDFEVEKLTVQLIGKYDAG